MAVTAAVDCSIAAIDDRKAILHARRMVEERSNPRSWILLPLVILERRAWRSDNGRLGDVLESFEGGGEVGRSPAADHPLATFSRRTAGGRHWQRMPARACHTKLGVRVPSA